METLIEQIRAAYNRVKTKFPDYNQGQLAELIGVNRSTLSSALNGNDKYGSEKMLRRMLELVDGPAFPGERQRVPFYDMDVTAGIVEAYPDTETPAYSINFAPVNDCTAALPVYGESMEPGIRSGDIVFVRELHNRTTLQWGEIYLVVTDETCDNMRTIKRVYPHPDGQHYILRADNPTYRGDTVIPIASVLKIFIVKGHFARKQL
jgi:transcriptional regulator with XRE-family HTH domain